jgi:hypothetical protein
MRKKYSHECRPMRHALQELHDSGSGPGLELAAHLALCGECARFYDMLRNLPADMAEVRAEALEALPPPDLDAVLSAAARGGGSRPSLFDRIRRVFDGLSPAGRSRFVFASAAAVPILCAALVVGAQLSRGAAMRAEVDSFVTGLYSPAFLEGVEYDQAGASVDEAELDSWLEEMAGLNAAGDPTPQDWIEFSDRVP